MPGAGSLLTPPGTTAPQCYAVQASLGACPDPRTLNILGAGESLLGKVLGYVVWKAVELGECEHLCEIYCKQLKILGKNIDGLKSSGKK